VSEQPKGESLRKAVQWISEQREERPAEKLAKLIDEASLRFDLSPAEQETLLRTLTSSG
jgi:hypothetical protein